MDFSIVANIDNAIARSEFLRGQKQQMESAYYNADSPFNVAQKKANDLMLAKQRKPMVIEYYKQKGQIESVEMYINPQRLSIQTQKVKSKAYTRGGIFYHHWGDDHASMQLSGTVGLAGMRGIEQLEKIYHYSGTLLRYKDAGPEVINNGEQPDYQVINYEDPYSAFDYVLSNNIDDKTVKNIRHNIENSSSSLLSNNKLSSLIAQLMQGYENLIKLAKSSTNYSELYLELNSLISKNNSIEKYMSFESVYQEAQIRVKNKFSDYDSQLQILIAFDLAKSLFGLDYNELDSGFVSNITNSLSSYTNELSTNSISNIQQSIAKSRVDAMQRYIEEIQHYYQNNKLSRNDVYKGFEDIADELEDEWRPRQVFIYFEDRVYIGHFDNFSYSRIAETTLIQYELRFTVTRQIIVTSNSNKTKPRPSISNAETINPYTINQNDDKPQWVIMLDRFRNQALSNNLEEIKLEILRSKATHFFEVSVARNNGETISPQREKQILHWINQVLDTTLVNNKYLISKDDELYGLKLFNAEQFLYYLKLGKDNDINDAIEMSRNEIRRINKVVDKENQTYDDERKQKIKRWLIRVMEACGLYSDSNYIQAMAVLNR